LLFSEKPSQENEMTLIHHSVLENPVRVCIRGCELVLMSSIHAATLQFTRRICITTIIIITIAGNAHSFIKNKGKYHASQKAT
jgi:hypothetical protein